MRRALQALVVTVATASVASGCFIFQEDPPDRSCERPSDCFRAQGEVCNLDTGKCEIGSDAAPEPDAPPMIDADIADAPPADAEPEPTDADPADAT